MYLQHKAFNAPDDEEVKIWRYMDFTKFISLLDSEELYFARADTFEDKFEGSHPLKNIEQRGSFPGADFIRKSVVDGHLLIESMSNVKSHFSRQILKELYVNCWHMNSNESVAMWKLYVKSDEGIAIQSKFSKLKNSLIDEKYGVHIGTIKYLDYAKEGFEEGNLLNPFVHKRKSFEHERELRAAVYFPVRFIEPPEEEQPNGLKIKIDINKLIENIYVSPDSQPWFSDLVKQAIIKYGYNFKVVGSELSSNERPLF